MYIYYGTPGIYPLKKLSFRGMMILPEDELPGKTGRILLKIYSVSIQPNCVTEAIISIPCHEVFVEKKTKVILKL